MPKTKPSLDEVAKALLKEFPPLRRTVCAVVLSKNAALIEALRANGAGYSTIQRILKERYGEHIASQSIGRHLRGNCSCPRD